MAKFGKPAGAEKLTVSPTVVVEVEAKALGHTQPLEQVLSLRPSVELMGVRGEASAVPELHAVDAVHALVRDAVSNGYEDSVHILDPARSSNPHALMAEPACSTEWPQVAPDRASRPISILGVLLQQQSKDRSIAPIGGHTTHIWASVLSKS